METLVVTIGVAFRDRTWEEYTTEAESLRYFENRSLERYNGSIATGLVAQRQNKGKEIIKSHHFAVKV